MVFFLKSKRRQRQRQRQRKRHYYSTRQPPLIYRSSRNNAYCCHLSFLDLDAIENGLIDKYYAIEYALQHKKYVIENAFEDMSTSDFNLNEFFTDLFFPVEGDGSVMTKETFTDDSDDGSVDLAPRGQRRLLDYKINDYAREIAFSESHHSSGVEKRQRTKNTNARATEILFSESHDSGVARKQRTKNTNVYETNDIAFNASRGSGVERRQRANNKNDYETNDIAFNASHHSSGVERRQSANNMNDHAAAIAFIERNGIDIERRQRTKNTNVRATEIAFIERNGIGAERRHRTNESRSSGVVMRQERTSSGAVHNFCRPQTMSRSQSLLEYVSPTSGGLEIFEPVMGGVQGSASYSENRSMSKYKM